ncbi:DNA polymerase III subunit gamma/tau, partial [Myxococcota bacterium]|nr:DNA polymerase III subunit gamma/tau [Myxococcota bacterium]
MTNEIKRRTTNLPGQLPAITPFPSPRPATPATGRAPSTPAGEPRLFDAATNVQRARAAGTPGAAAPAQLQL